VDSELQTDVKKRKSLWNESIVVGSEDFVEKIHQQLDVRARGRSIASKKEGIFLKGLQPLTIA
jgi:hypothetical protein